MDTALEALLRAMMTGGWFTASDGDVESPTGYFAYVTNLPAEVPEVLAAFSDVTDAYGAPDTADMVGSFVARQDDQGFIHVETYASDASARERFEELQAEYSAWLDDDSEV